MMCAFFCWLRGYGIRGCNSIVVDVTIAIRGFFSRYSKALTMFLESLTRLSFLAGSAI